MSCYLITFQIEDSVSYDAIAAKIRTNPKWARVMRNVWIIQTELKMTDVRESISVIIGNNRGSVMVMEVSNAAWATYSVDKEITDWMKNNI
jgi:hypothetical protein